MKILIMAEHDANQLKSTTLHAISAAKQLSDEIHVLVVGDNCEAVATEVATCANVKQVLLADNAVYAHQLAENTAALIASIGKGYAYILASSSTFSKNLLPRVAALLQVGMLSDVVAIKSADTFLRPIYAGNALALQQTSDAIKIVTIRQTAFMPQQEKQSAVAIAKIDTVIPNTLSRFIEQTLTVSERPQLTDARVVIAGGRGFKNAENFHLMEKIADKLGAAIGASRAAVDAGFCPNDFQVGQTGKVVAPELYIAVGISGAIQHIAGMKDSKVVVAINNDPDAPIFEVADYALVDDLFKVLPELEAELAK